MELSWGAPAQFQYAPSTNGAPAASATWTDIPLPKQDSLQLNPTEGEEIEALDEAGDTVDYRKGNDRYILEWDEFVKKGATKTFNVDLGMVSGEYAIRIAPEDPTCEGILIDRCAIAVTKTYNVKDGIIRHHKAKVLKPATGKSVKPYIMAQAPSD